MLISERINIIEESKSVELSAIIGELRSAGEKIISLNVGEPDFPTHPSIKEATKNALDENKTRYSLVQGLTELRNKIAQKLKEDNNLNVSSENILLGNGSKHILYNIFQTIINEGDEVIIPSPYWVTFPESVKLAGGRPVLVKCKKNHQLDLDLIEESITNKTKAIIINSPNNPTGAMYPLEDLQKIVDLANKHNFLIISDEAYEQLVFGDNKHIDIAAISKDAFERTITVQSFSKSYCMTGFRIGYMVGPKNIIKAAAKLQSHLSGNNCTFAQYGAIAALDLPKDGLQKQIKILEDRKNKAYDLISSFLDVEMPQGAFYLFPEISPFLKGDIKTDEDLAKYILKETKVAVLPGSYFGVDNYLRISFANSEEQVIEGINRIKRLLCK